LSILNGQEGEKAEAKLNILKDLFVKLREEKEQS